VIGVEKTILSYKSHFNYMDSNPSKVTHHTIVIIEGEESTKNLESIFTASNSLYATK
jgi:hypothetical protein